MILQEKSFQQFINSKSGVSTEIGQIKPNASELDILMLKNKIANTILKMKELEKTPMAVNANQAECYIEVTKVSVKISINEFIIFSTDADN